MNRQEQLRKMHNTINDQYYALSDLCRTFYCPDADAETVERANDALKHLSNALVAVMDLVYMDSSLEEATNG